MEYQKLSMDALSRPSLETFRTADKLPFVVILDHLRSGLNVGSIFRTCDAFAIQELALCGYTVQPPHKEILKTALGSTESVAWRHFETTLDAVAYYQKLGYQVFAVEQAVPRIWLNELSAYIHHTSPLAFVFGNEVEGVADTVLAACQGVIEVPQFGTKHSLNVAVTVGLVLWELARTYTTKKQ
jgi:23S rRNA (guanosine2251-2'-O)-methyltransferase